MLCNFFFMNVFLFHSAIAEFLILTVVLTFLLLLFGEIMPKIYSAQKTLAFCRFAAPGIMACRSVFYPLSSLLVRSTSFLNKHFVRKNHNISVDELSHALELTDKAELSEENNILEGIIRFGGETAKEVMTSRLDVVDLEIRTPFKDVLKCIVENAYSRIPVYAETRDNIKGVLYAVVSSATFGLIPLFSIPLLHAGMASPTILFYRMLLSAAIMAAVALLLKRNFRISRRDFGVLAGLSLMYAATSLGLLRSYDYIPSGVATTVNFLYPLVVTIVMTLFFRERSSVWIVIAVFISLVGVALLAWGDAGNNDPGRGLIYAGTTVFTYAVYIIGVMKSRAGRLDPLIVAFYVLTFSAAVFLVYALSTSGIAVVHTWHIWRNLLLLALLPTVLSNLTLVLAIKHIGSTMTSILGSMEPLTAVLVGVVHFGEGFDLDSAAGLILVVTAVIIVILQTNHTPRTPPANIPPTQPQE